MVLWQHVMLCGNVLFRVQLARCVSLWYVMSHSLRSITTQHDMLPQHHAYRNELNCECYNTTLARRNIAP